MSTTGLSLNDTEAETLADAAGMRLCELANDGWVEWPRDGSLTVWIKRLERHAQAVLMAATALQAARVKAIRENADMGYLAALLHDAEPKLHRDALDLRDSDEEEHATAEHVACRALLDRVREGAGR